MLMTTRVTITNETVDNCSLLQYDCKFRAESPNETYFIADIENFTVCFIEILTKILIKSKAQKTFPIYSLSTLTLYL